MQRLRNQGQFLNEISDYELNTIRSTYLPDAPLVWGLHNPSAGLINVLAHFGSRNQRYHICNCKHQLLFYVRTKMGCKKNQMIDNEVSKFYVLRIYINHSYNVLKILCGYGLMVLVNHGYPYRIST